MFVIEWFKIRVKFFLKRIFKNFMYVLKKKKWINVVKKKRYCYISSELFFKFMDVNGIWDL